MRRWSLLGRKSWFVGRVRYGLRREGEGGEGGDWKIVAKTIILIDRHQPIEALSFIL